jgi:hypothetical protein
MKSLLRTLLFLFVTVILITSCKKGAPKQTTHIPKNAVFVATINTKSLQNKLAKNQASLENILTSATGNDTSLTKGKQEWEDLKSSGIDLSENFYIAVTQKAGGTGTSGPVVITAIGSLSDEKKLENYIKKKQPSVEIRKEKNYSYSTFEGDKMVAWADDLVITMSYQNSFQNQMEFDTSTHTYNFKAPANAQKDLKAEMDSYFNLKEDQSVASIPAFRDLMQEKSDGSFWVNSSSGFENIPLPLPRLKELVANTYSAATVNFEDGKVAVNSKSYYSKELQDILKKYSGSTVDLNTIESYPSNNINGFAAFSFNPEMINALVKFMEVGGIVDGYLTKMMGSNYTLSDALKAIKGDFTFIVSDVNTSGAPNANGGPMGLSTNFKMLANIPVGDKTQMNRIMDKLVENQLMVKTPQGYTVASDFSRMGFSVIVDDKNVFIARDETLLNQYKAKTGKAKLDGGVMEDFKGKSGVSYVNIESILNGIPTQTGTTDSIMVKAKSTFKDMKGYLENFNGDYMAGHYELRFKDEKENSLTSLLQFFETVSRNAPKNNNLNRIQIDTIPAVYHNREN